MFLIVSNYKASVYDDGEVWVVIRADTPLMRTEIKKSNSLFLPVSMVKFNGFDI
jgi:hypothetical protein